MTLYVDTSALLKRQLSEEDSPLFDDYLMNDPVWISGRQTEVEVGRNLTRLLDDRALIFAQQAFRDDWERTNVVELDATVCGIAADIAEITQARTLDALHQPRAQPVGGGNLPSPTADIRQARVARDLG